ncbi:hypothetical protein SASPL_116504 [Salvia splendens]|uniref:RRM domain-containing protein n=1 Tax=Salvia splendens TaxID=180675 RepID=A0A8X8XXK4_SALSN|nr:hypothetical protein SASPL_116504 [Salvia splendens]
MHMACFNKVGTMLRQSISASSALSGQSSMLNAMRLMSTKLFIGGLSYQTDDQSLRDAFSSFGEVDSGESNRVAVISHFCTFPSLLKGMLQYQCCRSLALLVEALGKVFNGPKYRAL